MTEKLYSTEIRRINMNEIQLKYGCNPNQKPARIYMADGSDLPLEVLNGRPGYINFLDALNSWQLVRELREATGLPCAASFKHVSPTSAALGLKLDDRLKKACFVDDIECLDDSPLACAFARARGTDRMSSYGDFIALSDKCDVTTALLIRREVSDGIIAPDYDEDALAILKAKKKGNYNIIKIDPEYECAPVENKQVFGITFQQNHNDYKISRELLNEIVTDNKDLTEEAARDMIVALITLKYTQSNSVVFSYDGQAIGVGAGQQSRIHCTRLAGSKADTWFLRQSDKVLNLPFRKDISRPDRDNVIDGYINKNEEDVTAEGIWQKYFTSRPEPFSTEEMREYLSEIDGVTLGSDAFFPFGDNIERAHRSGVRYVVQPGGSIRDDNVIDGYINKNEEDVTAEGIWQKYFTS
ncbi:MAG: phosphoribosylaminoimidazolecarboxamide formyltransferase, partial [Erysipelotrichaceae bacterium]|nr:phosphoribosylaminoimidazolecarboxamide formyltransferase [Erysipelotrichaceae bacterium]